MNKPIINQLLDEIKKIIKSCPYIEDEDLCNMCSPFKKYINKLETQISNMQKGFNNALHEIKKCWETPPLFNGVEKDIIKTGICLDDAEKGLKQYSHGGFYEDLCFRLNSFYDPKLEIESE